MGVERPSTGRRIVQSVVDLGDGSLATSGDYRRFREEFLSGKRYESLDDALGVFKDDPLAAEPGAEPVAKGSRTDVEKVAGTDPDRCIASGVGREMCRWKLAGALYRSNAATPA